MLPDQLMLSPLRWVECSLKCFSERYFKRASHASCSLLEEVGGFFHLRFNPSHVGPGGFYVAFLVKRSLLLLEILWKEVICV